MKAMSFIYLILFCASLHSSQNDFNTSKDAQPQKEKLHLGQVLAAQGKVNTKSRLSLILVSPRRSPLSTPKVVS